MLVPITSQMQGPRLREGLPGTAECCGLDVGTPTWCSGGRVISSLLAVALWTLQGQHPAMRLFHENSPVCPRNMPRGG